ncbi:MAG: hypothetical protein KDC18_09965 [Alphaproteobacteria bacterium]|nr:hypothetical protein [Alphaproteobacteria bacterium]MCB1739194.1 hypothetical protein [Gammaproteobacteria bacterium]
MEKIGIPALGVMTSRFVSAAELMSKVLGSPGYGFAVIDHPVSSASDDALRRMARQTLDNYRSLLLRA